jgi:hypothetical protein
LIATQNVEIKKIAIQDQPRQKVSQTRSQLIQLGMVVQAYYPSYMEGKIRGLQSRLAQAKT